MRWTELGGDAGDPAAADCYLKLVYAGRGFGAVVRGEGWLHPPPPSAAAAVAAAAAGSDVQRLKSLQFGEYCAVLRCDGGGQGILLCPTLICLEAGRQHAGVVLGLVMGWVYSRD